MKNLIVLGIIFLFFSCNNKEKAVASKQKEIYKKGNNLSKIEIIQFNYNFGELETKGEVKKVQYFDSAGIKTKDSGEVTSNYSKYDNSFNCVDYTKTHISKNGDKIVDQYRDHKLEFRYIHRLKNNGKDSIISEVEKDGTESIFETFKYDEIGLKDYSKKNGDSVHRINFDKYTRKYECKTYPLITNHNFHWRNGVLIINSGEENRDKYKLIEKYDKKGRLIEFIYKPNIISKWMIYKHYKISYIKDNNIANIISYSVNGLPIYMEKHIYHYDN